jgi:hypothetical protein
MVLGTRQPGVRNIVLLVDLRLCLKLASYGGPAKFATKVHTHAPHWSATGDLEFINQWTYKLGEEVYALRFT